MPSKSLNRSLHAAKATKQDEFYTQLSDIEKELVHYKRHFKNKTVLCNCDDPRVSNFFKYFLNNFEALNLKRLITTCFQNDKPDLFSQHKSPHGIYFEYSGEQKKQRLPDPAKITPRELQADGDFRSDECVNLFKQADIVVTNPPFSLFHEYVAQFVAHEKQFLIIGSKNWITYTEFFPLIKAGKLWMGVTPMSKDMLFDVPPKVAEAMFKSGKNGSNYKLVNGKVMGRSASVWFTNLDHGRRHQTLPLMTMEDNIKFSKHKEVRGIGYERYCNFGALEVPFTDAIPSDFDGIMGVPISFLDKYNPDQFEIIANGDDRDEMEALGVARLGPEYIGNTGRRKVGVPSTKKAAYKRILIRHHKSEREKK